MSEPETLKEGEEKTEDQIVEEISSIESKEEKTPEDDEKLKTLTSERNSRVQKRINELTARAKVAEEEKGRFSQEAQELRAKVDSMEAELNKLKSAPVGTQDVVDVGGKQYYTDEALSKMVDSGRMTQTDAYKHQQERIKKEAAEEAYQRIKGEQQQSEEMSIRQADAKEVLSKYPHFDKNNPRFNPNDPIYVKAQELYADGLSSNPRGLSKAVKIAEDLLGVGSSALT